ncbi:hypothetical protein BD413DRAFT_495987 [Trametes elegans]|nr:hypothetical protein BD413DRAFT_495987 [Trametes elegans]
MPSKKIILQDDLESFFHVLLYTAVRFLPHNCPDKRVGALLYRYFDDYAEVARGQMKCGPLKRTSVKDGKISLETIIPENVDLVFRISHSSPSLHPKHPINKLIDTVLSWLRAYNRVSTASPLDGEELARSGPAGLMSTVLEELQAMDPQFSPSAPESEPTSTVTATHPSAIPGEEQETVLAAKLDDHEAMLHLFLDAHLRSVQISSDKGPDKKPLKGYDPEREYYRGNGSGIPKACRLSGESRDVARSGNPSGSISGSGKRPHDGEDERVDVRDRPTTPKRPRAALPRSDARSGP